ncbi:hypothetical protein THAOC_13510 [Thalassiosira oceanica]|uniref:Uncharacterized protein n=1 Tax=Thalassiosira oceanica TaxID=159749 RepID=K0SJV9_THAOC|nr:hypothetical protein THAOC_13510 [Thalassiosira oceanica]|eukprot:EJK65610.1 hypothetical protein THAOC_13510 [Thalassiosira oceanica]
MKSHGRGRTRVPRPHRPAARPRHDIYQPSPPEDAASAGENSPGVAAAIQLGVPRGSALQQSPRDDDDHYVRGGRRLNLEFAASAQPASASDPDGDTHGGDTPGPEGRAPGEDTPETESDAPGGDTPETEGDTPGTGGDTLKLKAARLDLEPGGPTGRHRQVGPEHSRLPSFLCAYWTFEQPPKRAARLRMELLGYATTSAGKSRLFCNGTEAEKAIAWRARRREAVRACRAIAAQNVVRLVWRPDSMAL